MSSILQQIESPRTLRWPKTMYHQVAELGLFRDKRVELIEGEVVEMSPMGSSHWLSVNLTAEILREVFAEGYFVTEQCPIDLNATTEPEPDVAVIRGRVRDYKSGIPKSAALIVEVSDTTFDYDNKIKRDLYAAAGIPEYWVVDINKRRVLIYRQGANVAGYEPPIIVSERENISPSAKPDKSIAVIDLLPDAE